MRKWQENGLLKDFSRAGLLFKTQLSSAWDLITGIILLYIFLKFLCVHKELHCTSAKK